jgi:hypothetical protein
MGKITGINIGGKHFDVSEDKEDTLDILKSPSILELELEETVFNNNLQVVINGVKFFRDQQYFDVPKHESVAQWQARTDETYPKDAPVWYQGRQSTHYLVEYGMVKTQRRVNECIVANHYGKPSAKEIK